MRLLPQTKKNKNKVSKNSGNGLKKTNSRPKNETTKNNNVSGSSSQPTITDVVPKEPSLLKTRRIVKATTPTSPPPSVSSQETDSFSDDLQIMDDSRISERSFVGIKAPAVQQEELQEKVQQWRKERFEASAAVRKEHKEKEIKEHRMRNSTSRSLENRSSNDVNGERDDDDDHSGYAVLLNKSAKDRIPSILSVLPKFPEHKRKKPSFDHDGLKKLKTAEELQELNNVVKNDDCDNAKEEEYTKVCPQDDKGGGTESWSSKAVQVIKSSTPVAGVIVAVFAIFVTRWMRNK
jgi:hypothetical protein